MDADELVECYDEVAAILDQWHITTINDFFTFQLYDLLARWSPATNWLKTTPYATT